MKPPAPQTRAVRTKRASLQDNALGANYSWASPGQSGQKDAEDVGPGFGLKDMLAPELISGRSEALLWLLGHR
jgi:hypothetical protein